MKAILYGLVGAALAAGAACAQTSSATPEPGTAQVPPRAPAQVVPNSGASTSGRSADMPAKGANSFTEGEARNRIGSKGFSYISGLSKNHDGIWEGKADKGGRQVTVWLDYKGNVGDRPL